MYPFLHIKFTWQQQLQWHRQWLHFWVYLIFNSIYYIHNLEKSTKTIHSHPSLVDWDWWREYWRRCLSLLRWFYDEMSRVRTKIPAHQKSAAAAVTTCHVYLYNILTWLSILKICFFFRQNICFVTTLVDVTTIVVPVSIDEVPPN